MPIFSLFFELFEEGFGDTRMPKFCMNDEHNIFYKINNSERPKKKTILGGL
jgi:hypothetical protein